MRVKLWVAYRDGVRSGGRTVTLGVDEVVTQFFPDGTRPCVTVRVKSIEQDGDEYKAGDPLDCEASP